MKASLLVLRCQIFEYPMRITYAITYNKQNIYNINYFTSRRYSLILLAFCLLFRHVRILYKLYITIIYYNYKLFIIYYPIKNACNLILCISLFLLCQK